MEMPIHLPVNPLRDHSSPRSIQSRAWSHFVESNQAEAQKKRELLVWMTHEGSVYMTRAADYPVKGCTTNKRSFGHILLNFISGGNGANCYTHCRFSPHLARRRMI